MPDRKEYQLAYTILKQKYVVSTMYRQSSAMLGSDMWYYETCVFHWDNEAKKKGSMVDMEESGSSEQEAISSHCRICASLLRS